MFLPDKSKRHTHLTRYLREAARRRVEGPETRHPALIAVGSLLLAFAGWFAVTSAAMGLVVVLLCAALLFFNAKVQVKKEPDARERLMLESQPVVRTMLAHAESKRLHRELDEASLDLLEECARHYWRVQAVFESPFWSRTDLPMAYLAAREQALKAAETGMDELMLLYRNSLPESPSRTSAIEYVEEALEEHVFKGPRSARQEFLPPTFEPTRRFVEQLKDLADEAEAIGNRAQNETMVRDLPAPGSALEATLGELRQIRQAEDELRQNIGGTH